MIEKITELQKKGFSKKQIFENLRTNDINDIFLSKELVRLAEFDKKKEFYWIHNFYISIFFIKSLLFLFLSHGLPWESWENVFTVSDLLMIAICYNFYFWKNWNQLFYIISGYLNLFVFLKLILIKIDPQYEIYIFIFLLLDGCVNFFLARRIYGRFLAIKLEKDPATGLYKF